MHPLARPHCSAACLVASVVLASLPLFVVAPGPARAEPASSASSSAIEAPRIAASATTRNAMRAIRDAVTDVHSLVTHRRLGKSAATSFAAKVHAQIARIRDEVAQSEPLLMTLAPLLQQISDGAEAVAGRHPTISPIDGIVAIDEALATYPKRVEHPDWKAPRDL